MRRSTSSAGAAALAALIACASAAHANGAFPDSESLLLPAGQPALFVLATNFGLIVSQDGAATWAWSCETEATTQGRLYSLDRAGRRIFAVTDAGLAFSDDQGCSWSHGAGALVGTSVVDAFPDPSDARRVWAAAALGADAGSGRSAVYLSRDGGATFDSAAFRLPPEATVTGLEVASSDPQFVYVAFREGPGVLPRLARSEDGGGHFVTLDLEPQLGRGEVRILGIDRSDPRRVYLRWIAEAVNVPHDRLVVSGDGGSTWTMPVELPGGRLLSFLQRQDGTLLATGLLNALGGFGQPTGVRSRDGGRTFEAWPLTVRARGLAERAGRLYAATDDLADGYAVAIADAEDGPSWTPLLSYARVTGIRACARFTCFEDCINKAVLRLWDEAMCRAEPVTDDAAAPPDGGSGTDAGRPRTASGCSCGLTAGGGDGAPLGRGVGPWLVVVLGLWRRAAQARAQSGGSRRRNSCSPAFGTSRTPSASRLPNDAGSSEAGSR